MKRRQPLVRYMSHTLPDSGLTCIATKHIAARKTRKVVIYIDVENGCHGLLKALAKSRLRMDTCYEIRAYTGNSMVKIPTTVDPGRTFLAIRNDLPLKELTDIAIILDLSDALMRHSRPGAGFDEKHVLVAGNDKRYAALNHVLQVRNSRCFQFLVNLDKEKSLRMLASL